MNLLGLTPSPSAVLRQKQIGTELPAMKGISSSCARSYIHFASSHDGARYLSMKTGTERPAAAITADACSKKWRLGYICWPSSFSGSGAVLFRSATRARNRDSICIDLTVTMLTDQQYAVHGQAVGAATERLPDAAADAQPVLPRHEVAKSASRNPHSEPGSGL